MFDNIAPRYDLLNHTLSVNIDRIWRRRAVNEVRRAKPRRILDVATGTGDLAIAMARRIEGVQVMGVDLSEAMLAVARRKVEARGLDNRIVLERGDAEHLAVADASVDAATVAFGVRNFGDLAAGLHELARTIKPWAKSLSWSSRGPATGCSGHCTSSTPTRFCPASAGWCRATNGPTNTCRPRSGSFPPRRSFWE